MKLSKALRGFARGSLATIFVTGGLDVIQHPEGRAQVAQEFLDKVKKVVPMLPDDNTTIVKANAALQVGAGAMLGLGIFPRIASWLLITSLVPTTIGGHPFWGIEDPKQRAMQRAHFNKNVGILGGLIFAALDAKKPTKKRIAAAPVKTTAKTHKS